MNKVKVVLALFVGIVLGVAGQTVLAPSPQISAPLAHPSEDDTVYQYSAEVIRIIDGDTIQARVDLGMRIVREVRLRFKDIDAPEMNTQAGKDSKEALTNLIPVGSAIVVKTFLDPGIYDRYTATVYFETSKGQVNVNDWLVNEGYAKVSNYKG